MPNFWSIFTENSQTCLMKTRILGLDTGTNSLGWAVVDRDEHNQYTPICRGDLIFALRGAITSAGVCAKSKC